MQRQLAPPVDMITASEDNEVLIRQRPRDPAEAEKWDKEWKSRMEQHQILNKKLRARVLMDQKATSVADVAAVLTLQEQKMKEEREREARESELEDGDEGEEGGKEDGKESGGEVGDKDKAGKKLSRKRRKRIQAAIKEQQKLEQETMEKISELERMLKVKIDPSLPLSEHHIVNEGEVKMFWMDLHNLQYAEPWPKNVIHGQLKAVRDHVMGTELDIDAGELARGGAPAAKAGDGEGGEQAETEAEAEAEGEQKKEEASEEEKAKFGLGKLKFW